MLSSSVDCGRKPLEVCSAVMREGSTRECNSACRTGSLTQLCLHSLASLLDAPWALGHFFGGRAGLPPKVPEEHHWWSLLRIPWDEIFWRARRFAPEGPRKATIGGVCFAGPSNHPGSGMRRVHSPPGASVSSAADRPGAGLCAALGTLR